MKVFLSISILLLSALLILGGGCETEEAEQTNRNYDIAIPDDIHPDQVKTLTQSPSNPKTYYAILAPSMELDVLSFIGVMKSEDRGANWEEVFVSEFDVLDFKIGSDGILYVLDIYEYGGGSMEVYLRISVSRDNGKTWETTGEIAKNEPADPSQKQPFITNAISDLIIDQENPGKSYLLYKSDFGSKNFNMALETTDYWETWEIKELILTK